MKFKNRTDAAKQLLEKLTYLKNEQVVVYALPRGGVELGAIVANYLNAPLDLIIPRKIGYPGNPEFAVCALTDFGGLICNEADRALIDETTFNQIVKDEQEEARRRREVYLKGLKPIDPKGKTVLIVDDGIATGLTIKAAIASIKKRSPKKIVVVVPVLPLNTLSELEKEVSQVIAVLADPNYLGAVGSYYEEFPQVEDKQVVLVMKKFHSSK